MSAPEVFVQHLKEQGYHPRSNKHSNALSQAVLRDLVERCQLFNLHARAGAVVFELNQRVFVGHSEWNVDMVVGPPHGPPGSPLESGIGRAVPSTIRVAFETKCIMTEHKKAQRNRLRDLDSFHQFVHRYNSNTIAATLTVFNIAPTFRSLLRSETTVHRNPAVLVREGIGLMRTLPMRAIPTDPAGLEANAVIVVAHDSQDLVHSSLYDRAPAPRLGDPLHYDSFIQRICEIYRQRWA